MSVGQSFDYVASPVARKQFRPRTDPELDSTGVDVIGVAGSVDQATFVKSVKDARDTLRQAAMA